MSFLSKVTVEPVAFLFVLTIYIEYTALQDVIYTKMCHSLYSNYSDENIQYLCLKRSSNVQTFNHSNISTYFEYPNITIDKNEISRLLAIEMKYYMATFSICAVIASLWAGSWSDYYGRKRVLILPSALGVFAEISFGITSYYMNTDSTYALIYIAAVFNGISGGSTTVISTCFGYVSDVTLTEERSMRITFLESALFIGGFIGYNLAGLLIKYVIGTDYWIIFVICSVLHIILITYVMIFIPETRGFKVVPSSTNSNEDETLRGNEVKSGRSHWLSLNHVKQMFNVIIKPRPSRKIIHLLIVASAISSLTLSVQLTLTYVYVKRLKWDTYLYSLYNSINFLVSGISLIIILPLCYYKFGAKDSLFSSIGFISKTIGLINFGLSSSDAQIFATILCLSLSEFTMPAIRSLMSKLVSVNERAKAFSLLGSIQNLVQFFGSLIFPTIFSVTIHFFPGLVFLIVAIFQSFASLILLYIHFKVNLDTLTDKSDD